MDTHALWRREDTTEQFLKLIQDPFKSAVSIVCALVYFYFPPSLSQMAHSSSPYLVFLLELLELTWSVSNQRRLGFIGHLRRLFRPACPTLFAVPTSTHGCLRP